MIPNASNSNTLLSLVSSEGLYQDLLKQVIKDFQLSGLSINLGTETTPTALLEELHYQVKHLIHTNFDGLMQVLYRVDIPEQSWHSNEVQDSEEVAKKMTYFILKREWKKVYYRKKYS